MIKKSFKNTEENKNQGDEKMLQISMRILIAAVGGGLIFYGLSTLYNNFWKLPITDLVNILSIAAAIIGFVMIYKGRYF